MTYIRSMRQNEKGNGGTMGTTEQGFNVWRHDWAGETGIPRLVGTYSTEGEALAKMQAHLPNFDSFYSMTMGDPVCPFCQDHKAGWTDPATGINWPMCVECGPRVKRDAQVAKADKS